MSDSTTTRTGQRRLLTAVTISLFALPSLFSMAATGDLIEAVESDSTTSVTESVKDVTDAVDSILVDDVDETVDTVEETTDPVVDTVESVVETVVDVVDDTKEQVEKVIEDPEQDINDVINDLLPGDSDSDEPNEPDSSNDGSDAAPSDDEEIAPPPANPEPAWDNPTWNTPTIIGAESPHGRAYAIAAPSSASSVPEFEPLVAEAFSGPIADSPLVARPLHPLRSVPLLAAIAAGLLILATVGHAANARVMVRSPH